jgi:hypothetical protein
VEGRVNPRHLFARRVAAARKDSLDRRRQRKGDVTPLILGSLVRGEHLFGSEVRRFFRHEHHVLAAVAAARQVFGFFFLEALFEAGLVHLE